MLVTDVAERKVLKKKCISDNIEMLVTVLTVYVSNILYGLTCVEHQHPKDDTNIEILLPTLKLSSK